MYIFPCEQIMKLYSFLGGLYFLIFFYITSQTLAIPFSKRSTHADLNYDRGRNVQVKAKYDKLKYLLHNIKDIKLRLSEPGLVRNETSEKLQEVKHTTKQINSGNVQEFINRNGEVVSFAALTQTEDKDEPFNMVIPIAGTLTVLFSMSILVAIFQCCCRKRRHSDTEDVKSSNEKLVDSGKNSGNEDSPIKEEKTEDGGDTQGSEKEENEVVSIRSKIKAFEGVIPTQPSPGPIRPTKKRPDSNAFKAFENQGIIIGMGKSPSRLSKTPEDENQNATIAQEVSKEEEEQASPDDDLSGYKQPENPDVVIDDVDESDEFAVIKRDTSVLRSYKKAPPPKNRNRSSAAVRRKRARETTTDLLFNDSSDNSFLNVPDDLEVVYTNDSSKTGENGSKNNTSEKNKNKKDKSDSTERNKNKKDKNELTDKNKTKKDKNDTEERNKAKENKENKGNDKDISPADDSPSIVTTDFSDDKIIDISKQEVPPEVFSGGNIFMHIDPTVKKKNEVKPEKKPATPPTRLRTSQLSVEERREKAKSTPLLSSHEDLAKALGKLKSPSKESNKEKTAGKNRSSTDLSSNSHL